MHTLSPDNPVNLVPQPAFKAGKPVTPKYTKPSQVRSAWLSDWQADISNRLVRAQVQGMSENKPPFDPQRMKEAGLSGCCNINWRDGQLAIRKKMEPYVLMLQSMPVFLNIRTKFGSPQEQNYWGRKMSQRHATTMRSWESFTFRHQANVQYLQQHGASFCYFNDSVDWRWHAAGMSEMTVPRLSKSDAQEFPRLSMARDYEIWELWDHIKDAVAKKWNWSHENKDGWNVKAVKKAIECATYKEFFKSDDFENNLRLWKNKETTYAKSSKVVQAILMWPKEDDGTVSQLIATKTLGKTTGTEEEEEFLYKRTSHFPSMRNGVVTFTRDIGTNGFFHSIRGTGSDIYPMVQKLNELKCSMYDAIKLELSVPLTGPEEILASENAYVFGGPFTFIAEGVAVAKDFPVRNYSNSAFPGLQMLNNDLHKQSGQSEYPEQPGSKIDLSEMLNNMSCLDVMELSLFFIAQQRLLRESLRRMIAIKHKDEPGGEEAMEFRRGCEEDGVPPEAIDQIDIESCIVVRPIGNGSPQARMFTMDAMQKYVPFMDEEGRYNWLRDGLAALPGMDWSTVDRYAPMIPDMRPTQQMRNAMMENTNLKMLGIVGNPALMDQEDVPVLPNDDHIVHLEQHAPAILKIVQVVESGEMLIEEAVRPLYPLYLHASEHIMAAGDNPVMRGQLSEFNQALHNAGEIITNGQRKLQKQQEQAMREQQSGNGEAAQGEPRIYPDPLGTGAMLTPSEMGMMARTQIHLQDAAQSRAQADELHRMKVAGMRQDAMAKAQKAQSDTAATMQKMQLNDLSTAAKAQASFMKARSKPRPQ